MYDIAIIGAGPAGAALAKLIGNSHKVLLVDKRELLETAREDSIAKCCGGLVAPDAQKVLAELGLGLPEKVLTGPQLFVVRTIDLQNNIERFYQRFYINMDREKFDRWLVSMVPGCVDMRFGHMFKAFEEQDGCFKIKMTCKGREYIENAKMLIGADGASSPLRSRAFGKVLMPKKYVAIQEWVEAGDMYPYFSAVFDREITDFYAWTIPKDNFLVIGAALEPGDTAADKFDLLKSKLSVYGFQFGKSVKREGAFILRPGSIKQIYTGKEGIGLLGEAAGWISPSSSEGLSYAFRSAILMSQSLRKGLKGAVSEYNRLSLVLKRNILIKNIKSPFMYNPFIRKAVMLSGVQSVRILK